jgi:hypothetical protein
MAKILEEFEELKNQVKICNLLVKKLQKRPTLRASIDFRKALSQISKQALLLRRLLLKLSRQKQMDKAVQKEIEAFEKSERARKQEERKKREKENNVEPNTF